MKIISIAIFIQFAVGQDERFDENDLVDPSFLDSLQKAQNVFDQECFIESLKF